MSDAVKLYMYADFKRDMAGSSRLLLPFLWWRFRQAQARLGWMLALDRMGDTPAAEVVIDYKGRRYNVEYRVTAVDGTRLAPLPEANF